MKDIKTEKIEIVAVDGSDYWAVFLSNNQVYFGKLVSREGQYLSLREVFYLRAQRQLQPAVEEDTKQQIQLIKLGSELHGPVDRMIINRDQILLTEELKEDSKVVTAITAYVTEQAAKK